MKINGKQTIIKSLFLNKIFLVLFAAAVVMFIWLSTSFAPTKAAKKLMTDSELSNVEGQALFNIYELSNVNGSANAIHIDLGIDVEILGYMTSSKMGYWNNGSNNGWDLDTTDSYYGAEDHSTSPLILHGVFMEFGFDNLTDTAARNLNYIEFGTYHATGMVRGVIGTQTGLFSNSGTGQNSGVLLRQTANFHQVVHFSNEPLSFVYAARYRYDTYGYNSDLKGIFQKLPNHNTNLST
jgi:hypothetical protein